MEKENKTSRASQTRSKSERPKVWVPPSSLDAPPAPDGFRYRWIRAETVGFQDTKNVTGRLREGYELVRAEEVENSSDYPVLEDGKYKGVIGVGGLLLAKVPIEIAKQRQNYMANRHAERSEAVANDLMKEQDQRMPINVERQSRVTFGGTKKIKFSRVNPYHRINVNHYWNRRKLWQTETHKVLDLSQLED